MIVSNLSSHLPRSYTGRVGVALCFPPLSETSSKRPTMHLVLANSACYINYERYWHNKQLAIADLENGKLKKLWVIQGCYSQVRPFTEKASFYSPEKEDSKFYAFLSKERDDFQTKLAEEGHAQLTDDIRKFEPLEEFSERDQGQESNKSSYCIIL